MRLGARVFTSVAMLIAASVTALSLAAPGAVADAPTPYPTDSNAWPGQGVVRVMPWMSGNRASFWRQRERSRDRVVFAGDSLIGGWHTLADDLPGVAVANRGIGGEFTRMLLFRLREDVLDLHPKAVVLLSGTNDLSAKQDVRITAANLGAMLDTIERAAPGTPVVICTIPPRHDPRAPVEPGQVESLNALIQALPQGRRNVQVLDLHGALLDADGNQIKDYFAADQLHLSAEGYQRWRDVLLPMLKRLN